jgi:hypothetical protein
MPRGDGTGPLGLGPMTGRAAGLCAGNGVPGYANPSFGRGFRVGRGRRFGGCFGYDAPVVPVYPAYGASGANPFPAAAPVEPGVTELDELKVQADFLKQSLTEISKRIEVLEEAKREKAE